MSDETDVTDAEAVDEPAADQAPDAADAEGVAVEESATAEEPPAPAGPALEDLPAAIEAVLMVVDEPVAEVLLASVLEHPVDVVAETLRALAADYDAQGRGFELREVAGGWRFYTREDHAPWVEKFVLDGQAAKLTQASLETLAVVAYRQPVSRGRVSAVRGVNVDGVMRTLVSRGLVEEAGHDAETTATLYRTTSYFLERIGVTSLDDLPELAPFLPEMGELDDLDARAEVAEAAEAG